MEEINYGHICFLILEKRDKNPYLWQIYYRLVPLLTKILRQWPYSEPVAKACQTPFSPLIKGEGGETKKRD